MGFTAANSKKQGDIGLGSAIAHFASIGCTVSIPLSDSQDYDLIVDNGSILYKVQVKTTSQVAPSGRYLVDLRTLGGNQSWGGVVSRVDKKRIALLYVLNDVGTRWVVPLQSIEANSVLTLRDDWLV